MEAHPELARSYNALSATARTSQRQQWEQLARSLNINGPPTKSVAEWKRIWTLRKYATKKKLTENKNSIKKTGGGPCEFKEMDATEESIIAACGMEASVTGVAGGLAFGSETKENNAQQTINEVEQLLEDLTKSPTRESQSILMDSKNKDHSASKKGRKNIEDEALKKQIDIQEMFFKNQLEAQNKSNEILGDIRDAILLLAENKKKDHEAKIAIKKEELQMRKMELEVAKMANELKLMEMNSKSQ